MSTELEKITPQYRTFTQGQYVDHIQFNEFLDRFEDQDRLSKVLLSGVGLVCGLEYRIARFNRRGIGNIGVVCKTGTAITTDGDTLVLQSKRLNKAQVNTGEIQFNYYQEYDNHNVKYAPFYKDGNPIELLELLESPSTDDTIKKGLISDLGSLDDKYLVLYLESYEKDARPCEGVDCDNQGVEKVNRLRLLITNKEGIEHIASTDSVYSIRNPRNLNAQLSDIAIKRPILNLETNSVVAIAELYTEIVQDTQLIDVLKANFDKITDFFQTENVFESVDLSKIILDLISDGVFKYQYVYAFLKEILATYGEIKTLISRLTTVFFPDFKAFPKHVMLGGLQRDSDAYRHSFYNAPLNDDHDIHTQILFLINRFNIQISRFSEFSDNISEVKIIPSRAIGRLGSKAIPFYYKANEQLRMTWDYQTSKNRLAYQHLSYFPNTNVSEVQIVNPLAFNQDHNDFYRIEGHQGKTYPKALEDINTIKQAKQLSFDVMVVSLTELSEQEKEQSDIKAYYAEYLKKHTGLIHKSGVYKGGTFIMVYESNEAPEVIADFTLPYLCCNKKKDYAISLPVENVCQDEAPFIITVNPINGVVKAFVRTIEAGNIEINAIENRGDISYFNPGLVPDNQLGKPILFTVNDKPVENSIIVFSPPSATITSSVSTIGDSILYVIITFFGLDNSRYEYEFDFYNDGNWQKVVPDAQGTYKLKYQVKPLIPLKTEIPVLVTDTITQCTSEYTIPVEQIAEPDVEITGVNYTDGDCCNGLEIFGVKYVNTGDCCIPRLNEGNASCSVSFEVFASSSGSLVEQSAAFSKLRGRYIQLSPLALLTQWEEFEIDNAQGTLSTPPITTPGTYGFQIQLEDEFGQLTDWFTAPPFTIEECLDDNEAPTADVKLLTLGGSPFGLVGLGGNFILRATAVDSLDSDGTIKSYNWQYRHKDDTNFTQLPEDQVGVDIALGDRIGTYTIRVKVKDNEGLESNWASVDFSLGRLAAQFSALPSSLVFPGNGGSDKTTITSDTTWNVTEYNSNVLTLENASGGQAGNTEIRVTATANLLIQGRAGFIKLTNANGDTLNIDWSQPSAGDGGGGTGPGDVLEEEDGIDNVCFDLESDILMASGRAKKLRNIVIGDELMIYDFKAPLASGNKEFVPHSSLFESSIKSTSKVVEFGTQTVNEYRQITLTNGKVMNVTSTHPLLASRNGEDVAWLLPDDLRGGAFLIDKNGAFVEIVSKRTINEKLEIGILQLASGDNYFVQGCMVHNAIILREQARMIADMGMVDLEEAIDVIK